ncbi:MAG: hypothetical protein DRM98_01595 [Thermoplasmata archaeon]|nr:MAG: hypothetical protein DRM98_01595 [Thermoplasmata archaeon]RLF37332.1 MAG: hypothetical protein DRM99_00640 [Thermoplasmata archaeon]RLF53701.1 MAG: hypothetical protein DRN24_00015 [Thermoplasmata archaeon]
MEYVAGAILTIDGFKKGYLGFENGRIVETGTDRSPVKPVCKGLIIPGLVNIHTHIGDSFVRKKNIDLPRDVESLVGPPDGLKHQLLSNASDEEIVEGMKDSINIMIESGTFVFCDFREGGVHGVTLLKQALNDYKVSPVVLSRPQGLCYDRDEIDSLLRCSHGIGVSSISDWSYTELEKIAKHTKRRKKFFALHACERVREDIDLILDLKPDFLVHMVKANRDDLLRVKDNDIPIVLCPRSNMFFGLKPNIKVMKQVGVDILLGTDNGMLNSPVIVDEVKFLKNQYSDVFSTDELLNMVTYRARKVLNLDCDILCPNSKAEFVVLHEKSLKPLYISLV